MMVFLVYVRDTLELHHIEIDNEPPEIDLTPSEFDLRMEKRLVLMILKNQTYEMNSFFVTIWQKVVKQSPTSSWQLSQLQSNKIRITDRRNASKQQ